MPVSAAPEQVTVTLPDGKALTFPKGVTGGEIAAAIGPGLAKAALIIMVDGKEWDLFRPIEQDAKIRIITKQGPRGAGADPPRHGPCAGHGGAGALSRHPGHHRPGHRGRLLLRLRPRRTLHARRPAQDRRRDARDHQGGAAHPPRSVAARQGGASISRASARSYKAELIASIPADEDVSIYWHGDWHDLCRGPHFRTTAEIGDAFKLTKISGAYWRGDAKNAQLQRIYGTAWRDKKELDAYLTRMEEAEKRDHRKIGKEMDLFHIQEDATGQVFWHRQRLYPVPRAGKLYPPPAGARRLSSK